MFTIPWVKKPFLNINSIMKTFISTIAFLSCSFAIFAQIDMTDSTAQVIGYWGKGEKQTYHISQEKFKVKGTDTTERQIIRYVVDITVKDSTEKSYLLEWHYKDYTVDSEDELMKKLVGLANDIKVQIETDEYGSLVGVKNWKEVGAYMDKTIKTMFGNRANDPAIAPIMDNLKAMWSSKEAIEANAIKDAQQIYFFHGGKYGLGEEVNGQIELHNNFGNEPFKADVLIYLDEIYEEDDDFIMRMVQTIDSKQLTDETYNFLKKAGKMGKELPPRSKFPALTSETNVSSLIHGSSGWVVYSVETKVSEANGVLTVDERVIDLQ
jgi:hypothetical protein